MVHYKCNTCSKVFDHHGNFQQHLNRKRPCLKPIADHIATHSRGKVHLTNNNEETIAGDIADRQKAYQCTKCLKQFTTYSAYNRHVNHRCKHKSHNKVDAKDKLIQSLMDELKTMKQHIQATNTTTVNSHNNNTTNNLTNNINITLVPFGKENLDFISIQQWISYFNNPHNCIPRITKDVHFNPNKPEYHNVFVSNINGKYVNVYDGKWKKFSKKTFIEKFINNKAFILIDKFDELEDGNKLGDLTKKRFERFKDWDIAEKLVKSHKDEIMHELYNNKSELE